MMKRWRLVFCGFAATTAAAAPLACGDDPGPAPADAGGLDEAAAEDPSDDGGALDASDDAKRRAVGQGVLNAVMFAPTPSAAATGLFQSASFRLRQPPPDAGPSSFVCMQVGDPTCRLSACERASDAASPIAPRVDAGPPPQVGTITVSGFQVDGGAIVMPVNDAGNYTTFGDPSAGWSGGQVITYSWPGAADPRRGPVGPFEAKLVTPAQVDITSPVPPDDGGAVALSRSGALVVTWTSRSPQPPEARVALQLYASDSTSMQTLTCSFPAADGTGTVPAYMMEKFKAETAGTLQLSSDVSVAVQQGEWDVGLGIAATPANAALYPRAVRFQ